MVAVITNGTAILGLGNLGALASKPVMEGKAVLFKRFADVDSIDLEVDTEDADKFIDAVRYLGPSFGGINLEDIKAPECFIIEQRLQELMDIPVFHDDQHGTAIIAAAGLINALDITGRDIKTTPARGQWRRRRRHCLRRTFESHGLHAGQCRSLRYQGRDLSRPHRRHEPVEVGPCGGNRRPLARRRGEGCRRLLRPVGEGRADQGNGHVDGAEADHLRHGQSGSGNHA